LISETARPAAPVESIVICLSRPLDRFDEFTQSNTHCGGSSIQLFNGEDNLCAKEFRIFRDHFDVPVSDFTASVNTDMPLLE
jgi:hypothetical protein